MRFPKIHDIIFLRTLLAYSVLGWVAVFANLIFVWSIFSSKNRKIKSNPNYLLCAQCIPDVGVGATIAILGTWTFHNAGLPGPAISTTYHSMEIWQGPACTAYGFLIHFFVFASGYTHVLTAWERFSVIIWPLRRKISLKRLMCYYICIWFSALVFASAPFLKGGFYLRPAQTNCAPLFVSGPVSLSVVVFILIAATLLISSYTLMFFKIKGNFNSVRLHRTSYPTSAQSESTDSKAERKIALQFSIIVACFLACVLPAAFTWFVASVGLLGAPTSLTFKKIEIFGFLFSTMNSALNPFLYVTLNKPIRRAVCVCLGVQGVEIDSFDTVMGGVHQRRATVTIQISPRRPSLVKRNSQQIL